MRPAATLAIILAALINLSQTAEALAQAVTQQVSFPAGSDSSRRADTITGDEAVRYLLGASAGQRMTVAMTTTNASAYFNITAPGATETRHIGSVAGSSSYSPDLNPIEQAFAKLKHWIRNAAPRSRDTLWRSFGRSSTASPQTSAPTTSKTQAMLPCKLETL